MFSASSNGADLDVTIREIGNVSDVGACGLVSLSNKIDGSSSNYVGAPKLQFYAPNGGDFYVWFSQAEAWGDPGGTGSGIRLDFNPSQTMDDLAMMLAFELQTNPIASAIDLNSISGNVVTVSNKFGGGVSDSTSSDPNIWATPTQGSDTIYGWNSKYLAFSTTSGDYYLWFDVDGAGADPGLGGRTGIQVNLASSDTINQAMTKAQDAANTYFLANGVPCTASTIAYGLVLTDTAAGSAASNSGDLTGLDSSITTPGVAGAVDTSANTISISSHRLSTGQAVTLSTTGSLPGGLSAGTTYYAISVNANSLKLASSAANAQAGTAIDITSSGSGTQNLSYSASSGSGSSSTTIDTIDISSAGAARTALDTLADQLQRITNERGQIGVLQSRLTAALHALQARRDGIVEARSRIETADIAEESARSVQDTILQQAGAAILSSANSAPRLALMLLS